MTPDPKTEALKPRYWQSTDDFPKVGTLWLRGKGDYREHLVVGFARPVAYITASCGCQPILCSDHVSDWRMENMEWSENRRDWFDCTIQEPNTRAPAIERDAEVAALRDFIESIAKGWDCDTGAGGSHASYCRCCEAEKLLASTAGTDFAERLRRAEEELRNRNEALEARRKYVAKCNHLPELVIDSENGPICCECWAIEEKARADRWQVMLEANNDLMPAGTDFYSCVEVFFQQVRELAKEQQDVLKNCGLAIHKAEEERDALLKVVQEWRAWADYAKRRFTEETGMDLQAAAS